MCMKIGSVEEFELSLKNECIWQARTRKVDVRLPGKGNATSNGARLVHIIITMIVDSDKLVVSKELLPCMQIELVEGFDSSIENECRWQAGRELASGLLKSVQASISSKKDTPVLRVVDAVTPQTPNLKSQKNLHPKLRRFRCRIQGLCNVERTWVALLWELACTRKGLKK